MTCNPIRVPNYTPEDLETVEMCEELIREGGEAGAAAYAALTKLAVSVVEVRGFHREYCGTCEACKKRKGDPNAGATRPQG